MSVMFRAKFDHQEGEVDGKEEQEILVEFDPSEMEETLLASTTATTLEKRRKYSR